MDIRDPCPAYFLGTHSPWLSLFNCSPQGGCLPSAWTPDSEELTTSRQPVLFPVFFSSQLEGSLFCDLPVCCPGAPPGSLGFSLWPLVAQSSHGGTLMKTINLKTAITAPSLTQCPGRPPFLQQPQACSHVWGPQLSWMPLLIPTGAS